MTNEFSEVLDSHGVTSGQQLNLMLLKAKAYDARNAYEYGGGHMGDLIEWRGLIDSINAFEEHIKGEQA